MKRTAILASIASLLVGAQWANAQHFLNVSLPGTSLFDAWGGLNSANFPGYGSYPGLGAWPTPILSNLPGSTGNAGLNKVSGSGYLSTGESSYIYSTLSGGNTTNPSPNNVVGTFSVADSTPVANIETVVFQIQISYWTSVGTPFPTGVLPTLSYNGETQNLAATYSHLTYSGPFTSPFGSGVADYWAFQWDLRGIEASINSFQINYSVTNHAQTYALQLDQSDTFALVAVPEPAHWAGAISLGLLGLIVLRRRRAHPMAG